MPSGSYKLSEKDITTGKFTLPRFVKNGDIWTSSQETNNNINGQVGVYPYGQNGIATSMDSKLQHGQQAEDPEGNTRGAWGRQLEFLLSCISMSVGLGNVWRFPNAAYENGGGAFLIPYLIILAVIGRPLYYMELVMGQFSGSGPIKVWKCVPALKGIGYAQMVSTFYIMVFYNYLMALCVFYFFASMQNPLPWTECNLDWASAEACSNDSNTTTLSQDYFYNHVVQISGSLENISLLDWRLALCLLMAWTCVFLSIIKGVESLGKVAYFTALFPYVILIALLVVALLNDGAIVGIEYFFSPKWEKLMEIKVWYTACEQSFFSLAVGYGALIMYSSYNDFRHNVSRDALIISVTDTFTSLLAGSVIFSVLGTLAVSSGRDIEKVVKVQGTGLAFIAYPDALGKIPYVPQLWSILFFFMLFTLGIGSSVAQIETILTPIRDRFPQLRSKKWTVALAMCLFCFVCGLSLATDSGEYIVLLLDNYGVGTAVFFYGICEVVGIMWIYGIKRFSLDITFMLGQRPNIFWKATWAFITPVALIAIFIYGNVDMVIDPKQRPGIPDWGNALGWALAAVALIQIPIWMTVEILRHKNLGFKEAICSAFRPTEKWGPRDPKIHAEWLEFHRRKGLPVTETPQYDNQAFVPN